MPLQCDEDDFGYTCVHILQRNRACSSVVTEASAGVDELKTLHVIILQKKL